MKIAIYTIISNNLGNRLQNYAVQHVLEGLGYQVKTIKRKPYPLWKRLKDNLRVYIKKDRYTNFLIFDRNIQWDYHYLNINHVPIALNNVYSYFVIGSDQIWNPTFDFSSNIDYLSFIDSNKIVSYAASFGLYSIPERYRQMVIDGINHITYISVREEAGAKIVKNLTGKDATVLIDPTMMLDAEEWMVISKKPRSVNTDIPYILTYFLGEKNNKIKNDLERYSKENNLTIYNLNDESQLNVYTSGPGEFVYLISHSSLVMTDSFHACVFAFLFNKPFLVYERISSEGSMMSRIDTFLSKFKLERKYVKNGCENELFECNYADSYITLKNERYKTLDFLKAFFKH